MNKTTKSTSRTKRAPAKTRTTKAAAKTTKSAPAKNKTTKTKTAAKTTKGKTAKTRTAKAAAKPRATRTRTKKVEEQQPEESFLIENQGLKNQEPEPPKELPRDNSPGTPDVSSSSSDDEPQPVIKNQGYYGLSSGLSSNNILTMAAMLRREEELENLRQQYRSHKDEIRKDQNLGRKEIQKNKIDTAEKRRLAAKNYYQQHKDEILPKVKRKYLERVVKEKGFEICPSCGRAKKPTPKSSNEP
jgi:hypothetical protein